MSKQQHRGTFFSTDISCLPQGGTTVRHFSGFGTSLLISITHCFLLCPSLQQDYKKQMLTAAHALAVDAKNLLDVIDQSRLKMMSQSRPH